MEPVAVAVLDGVIAGVLGAERHGTVRVGVGEEEPVICAVCEMVEVWLHDAKPQLLDQYASVGEVEAVGVGVGVGIGVSPWRCRSA